MIPWPRHDIVDAWPLASLILAVVEASTLQLTRGRALILVPPSAGGRRRCVLGRGRSESSRWVAGSVHYALGAAAVAIVGVLCYVFCVNFGPL